MFNLPDTEFQFLSTCLFITQPVYMVVLFRYAFCPENGSVLRCYIPNLPDPVCPRLVIHYAGQK